MNSIFDNYGQTILSAISAAAILGMAYLFLFGVDGNGGELARHMFGVLDSVF